LKVLLGLLLALAVQAQRVQTLCQPCHSEQVADFLKHPHNAKALSCDACHGASAKHREAAGGAPPDRIAGPQEVPALCGGCHTIQKEHFDTSKHAKVLAAAGKVKAPNCGTCHGVHAPNTPVQIEARCNRCHTQLPEACKAQVTATAGLRCIQCLDTHRMTLRRR
jgi:hypothetical protein